LYSPRSSACVRSWISAVSRLQLADLVLHEGDQGGDHQRHAWLQQRWQLKAKGLSAAGGHQREHVAPR
jgi:hypothetical protein